MFEQSHDKLNFQTVQPNTISNLLCNVNKGAGIDNISVRFLKDGADVLGIPLHKSVIYPSNYLTFRSLNPSTKKVPKQILKILDQSHFYRLSWESDTRPNHGIFNR